MPRFEAATPTLDNYWRAIILFGRNVASYKFALGKSLLELAQAGKAFVPLDELAEPYSRHLAEHLRRADKQTTSLSSRFLDACRQFNTGELSKEDLLSATVRLGFNNVIDAFHVVGRDKLDVRFFSDERKARTSGIALTNDLLRLCQEFQYRNLPHEIEARWRLVETAWELGLSPSLLVVGYDPDGEEIVVPSRVGRRRSVTSCRSALNGYQRGRCFYCGRSLDLHVEEGARADVDHFIPHSLREHMLGDLVDGVWNLVLACVSCNRGERGKHALLPEIRHLESLYVRNEYLIGSHHPLRDTLMAQTGRSPRDRQRFLNRVYNDVLRFGIHTWDPDAGEHPRSDAIDPTIAFYDANAADFAERTCGIDMSDLHEHFLELVPDGGTILDAGCGPGRDSAEFVRRGYSVTAFDASREMVRLCNRIEGVTVRHQTFEQIEDEETFDGVWASASLLHVPRRMLLQVLRRLTRALRNGGVMYMSFKRGSAEEVRDGRLFTDFDEESLAALIDQCPSLEVRRIWVSAGRQPGREHQEWVSALAVRSA